MMSNNINALEISGDQYRGKRFAIVDIDSGEVLDDAQGYGYKTAQKAYAAWVYKHRDTSKDRERAAKRQHIVGWLKKHKDFRELMDQIAFEIMKGSWGPDDKFDAKLVGELLKNNGYSNLDFTPGELLRVWRKM